MTTKWSMECPACAGEGFNDSDCTCGDDTCCCLERQVPVCSVCGGTGGYVVTKLTDDNCDLVVPLD